MPQKPGEENVRWGYGENGYNSHMLGWRYLKDAQTEMPRNQGVYVVRSMGKSQVGSCFP